MKRQKNLPVSEQTARFALKKWNMFRLSMLSLLLIGLAQFGNETEANAAEPTEDYEVIQKSTVRVLARYRSRGRVRTRYGTGWIIKAADDQNNAGLGTIVTAAHIVRGAFRITVVENDSEEEIVSSIKATDHDRDLAFVEVKDLSGTALKLTQKMPKLVAPLVAFGFQAASDAAEQEKVALKSSPKDGTLTKSFRGDGSLDLIEHSADVNPGYSGGPLIDKCGRVIGLITKSGGHINLGRVGSVSTAQGVGFAIGANEIVKFAGDENVDFQRDETECTDKAEVITQPKPDKKNENGDTEKNRSAGNDQEFSSNQMIAAAAIALGLLIAALAAFLFLRRNRGDDAVGDTEPSAATSFASTSFDNKQSGVTNHQNEAEISLSGRNALGQQIDVQFRSTDAEEDGLWLGADPTEVTGYIGDERNERLVSRVHAKIGYDGSNFTIMDNKSTNGTFIGNRKLSPMSVEILKSGDVIKLADIALDVSI